MQMMNTIKALAITGTLTLPSFALFVNGGFENGDLSGWTVKSGAYYGGGVAGIVWGATPSFGGNPEAVVGSGVDAYSGITVPFYGNYTAKLNDDVAGAGAMQISQTGTVTAADLLDSDILYFGWAAVMQNPGHPESQNPFFNITIEKNGIVVYNHDHISDQPGWTLANGAYNKSDVSTLSGLALGDVISVSLTVADCSPTGHFAYAYLDGFGTKAVTLPGDPAVPEPGTLALFGMGLVAGAGFLRRKKASK